MFPPCELRVIQVKAFPLPSQSVVMLNEHLQNLSHACLSLPVEYPDYSLSKSNSGIDHERFCLEMPIRNSQLEKRVAGNESTPVIAKHRNSLELGAGHLFLLYFLQDALDLFLVRGESRSQILDFEFEIRW